MMTMNLSKPGLFFDSLRAGLFRPMLKLTQVSGINAILDATKDWPLAYTAYGLATVYHETAHTMQPVKEYGGEGYYFRMYDPEGNRPEMAKLNGNVHPGDGAKYCGRGYVQLTWYNNYKLADDKLGLKGDLVNDPNLALDPAIAAKILASGMFDGWFTGHRLADYLPQITYGIESQFVAARRIINGIDCAALIAGYALEFQKGLIAAI